METEEIRILYYNNAGEYISHYDTGDPYTVEKRQVWHDLMRDSRAEKFGAPPQWTSYDIVPTVECHSCHSRTIIDKLTGTTSHSAGCDAV